MQNSAINKFLDKVKPRRMTGFVIVSNCVGDQTVGNIIGSSCGTRFPMQFDAVSPYLFDKKSDAEDYINLLQDEAKYLEFDDPSLAPIIAVEVEQILVDIPKTIEFLNWHAELTKEVEAK